MVTATVFYGSGFFLYSIVKLEVGFDPPEPHKSMILEMVGYLLIPTRVFFLANKMLSILS